MKDSIAVSRYRDVLATYLAPQWRMVLLLAALLCGNIGLQLYTPQLLRAFIDTALANGPARSTSRLSPMRGPGPGAEVVAMAVS